MTFCTDDPELPDAGLGVCCLGAAVYGPGRCTCWIDVYDRDQNYPLETDSMIVTRPEPCEDCAYRTGSPEKRGEESYRGSADELEELARSGNSFWCHQGMRRVVKRVHPSGAEAPSHAGDYAPPIVLDIPHKANGQPADQCAGWAARRAVILKEKAGPGSC